jgi:hypothetical protein
VLFQQIIEGLDCQGVQRCLFLGRQNLKGAPALNIDACQYKFERARIASPLPIRSGLFVGR